MEGVTRIGVSLEPELLKQFDESISKKGYVSRSEAIRDLVRDSLAESEWKNEDEWMVGTIVMVYDHTVTAVGDKITDMQHDHPGLVNMSVHVHLDHDKCMEILICEGKLKDLKRFADEITSVKGVLRGRLTMAAPSTGNLHHIGHRNRGRLGRQAVHSEHERADHGVLVAVEVLQDPGGLDGRGEHAGGDPHGQAPVGAGGLHDHAGVAGSELAGEHDEVLGDPDDVGALLELGHQCGGDVVAHGDAAVVDHLHADLGSPVVARVAEHDEEAVHGRAGVHPRVLHADPAGSPDDVVLHVAELRDDGAAEGLCVQDAGYPANLSKEVLVLHLELAHTSILYKRDGRWRRLLQHPVAARVHETIA